MAVKTDTEATKTTTRKKSTKPRKTKKTKSVDAPSITLGVRDFLSRLELANGITKDSAVATSTFVFETDVLTIYAGTRSGGVVVKMPHDSKIETPYTVAVDIEDLTAIVKSLAGELVELENDMEASCLNLYSASFSTKLQHFDAITGLETFDMDYNRTAEQKTNDPVKIVEMDAKQFVSSVLKTAYCVPTAEYQAAFRGVSISTSPNGHLEIVTTDGFRIAVCETNMTPPHYPLVPVGKTLETVAKMLREEGTLYMSYIDGFIQLEQNETRFLIPQYEGEYPDWRRVTSKFKHQITITFNTVDLQGALKRASLKTGGHNRIDFSYEGNNVVNILGMGDNGTIESREPLEVQVSGQGKLPFRRAFNYKYVEQAIKEIYLPTCISFGTAPEGICQFFGEGDTSYSAHVVPLRIGESL